MEVNCSGRDKGIILRILNTQIPDVAGAASSPFTV